MRTALSLCLLQALSIYLSVTDTFEMAEPIDEPHPSLACRDVGMVLRVFPATELYSCLCPE